MIKRDVHFGMTLPTSAPKGTEFRSELVGQTAEWAEKAGFHGLWVGDHIVHAMQIMEALICLAVAAGRTKTIQIGTSVLLLPMRQLSIVTSQLATLQNLSGGRFHLGLGVGGEWPKEWEAAGIDMKERGARFDEAVPLLRRLLAGEAVDFKGRFNSLPEIEIKPTPKTPVPFYFSGRVPAAIERTAKFGDGWIGFFLSLNGFKRDTALIDEARKRAGTADRPFKRGMMMSFMFDKNNDDADLRAAEALNAGFPPHQRLTEADKIRRFVVAGTPEKVAEDLQKWIDAGCEIFALAAIAKGDQFQEQLDMFAGDVLPRLKGAQVTVA